MNSADPTSGTFRPYRRDRKRDWAVVAVLLLMALVLTYPTALIPDRITTDHYHGEDAFIFCWNFWWIKKALLELKQSPFMSAMLYPPDGVDLAYHTLTPLHGLLSIPFQLAWPGPTGLYLAYNCFVIVSFFLAGLGMYLLARYVSGGRMPAFPAAVYYAYSNFRYANTTRLHVLSTEWLPFLFLSLLVWLQTGRKRYAASTALLALVVVYTSLEYAAYLTLFLPFFTLVWIWRRRSEVRLRAVLRPGSLGCFLIPLLAGAAILLPSVIAQRGAPREFVGYPPDRFVANLADFFLPNSYHPLFGEWSAGKSARYHFGVATYGLSLGYVAMLLVVGHAVFGRRLKDAPARAGKWLWLGWATVCLVFCLGPSLQVGARELPDGGVDARIVATWMPYDWVWHAVPFIRSSRSPKRWIALAQMFMAIVIALGVGRLMQRFARRRNWIFGLVLAALLFEQIGIPFPMMRKEIPQLYREIAANATNGCVTHMVPPWCCANLMFQTVHGRPLVDLVGYAMPAAVRRAESLPIEQTARSFWLYILPLEAMDIQSAHAIRDGPGPMSLPQRLDAARQVQRRFHLVYVIVPNNGYRRGGKVIVSYEKVRGFLQALGPTRIFEDRNQTLFIYDQYGMVQR